MRRALRRKVGVIIATTGRDFNIVDRGYTCCGGYEVVQLQYVANTNRCVGTGYDMFSQPIVTVRDCSSGDNGGVNLAEVPLKDGSEGVEFYNNTQDAYLASDNISGSFLFYAEPNCKGCYFKWNF